MSSSSTTPFLPPPRSLRLQSLLLSSITVALFLYLVVFMPYVKGVVPNCSSTPFLPPPHPH